jgi:hypothetical protein
VRRSPDAGTLVAGLATILLGAVLLLDGLEVVTLRFAWFAPLACAVLGAVLLARGLTR